MSSWGCGTLTKERRADSLATMPMQDERDRMCQFREQKGQGSFFPRSSVALCSWRGPSLVLLCSPAEVVMLLFPP